LADTHHAAVTDRSIMSTIAAVLHGIGDIRIEERPEPTTGPGRVIVQVGAVGICGSDVHYYEHGRIGDYVVRAPMIIGHEAAGTIVAAGDGVDPARVGELVALEPGIPDLTCGHCLAGRYNLCPDIRFFATPPVDGAIVSRLAFPAAFAHRAPAGLTAEQAAMAEPVSVGVWACRKAHLSPGDRVLVAGAGAIGLLAAQVARASGAESVTVTDVSEYRLSVAESLGFTAIAASASPPGEYDVFLECSGAQTAVTSGMARIAPAGRVVLVGMGADSVAIDVPLLQGREMTISGVFRYARTYPVALHMISAGQVDVGPVITHRFGLADTAAAMTLAHRDPHAIKAIISPHP
jgi:L-iditol 2-dehydrogenase